jgi:hypothetical protein
MSVEQYSAEFLKLSWFAPHLIPNKETKAKRFRNGLSPRIRERIDFLKIINYFKMVHSATIVEKGIREAIANYVNRKWALFAGALPPPPSKRQSSRSSFRSFGRRNTSGSRTRYSVSQRTSVGGHTGVNVGLNLEFTFGVAK